MSEFKFNCEQFLATTRQHFFASDLATGFQHGVPEDDSARQGGETQHRAHAGQ